ncbi:hypothetical protein LWI28_003496 [Acer negundo]|uniref:Reverse transcriptase RNase H-like domain-containing protein n=1 Tax=Acer negundo TaxID=4023 RepID=A0AAD5I4Y9_ACENE|nr:hypothetical protein LWI28_003496 [Acer negundo]
MIIGESKEEERGYTNGYPAEQMEEVPISENDPTKIIKIDGVLKHEVMKDLIKLIKEYNDILLGVKKRYRIIMHPADQDKTRFITRQGLYCYKVMSFGLKNAGATYQCLVNKLFKPQIGRSMEVYIDDMITKSSATDQHSKDLSQTFQLYLAVSETATSGALVNECDDGVQRLVYYVSRALTKSEKNYTLLEKFSYTLVTIARKLRLYFQAHTIAVVINHPLRQFLQRPDVSGRLVL